MSIKKIIARALTILLVIGVLFGPLIYGMDWRDEMLYLAIIAAAVIFSF